MPIDHFKSTFVTNSDASPAVANTAGEGGQAPLKWIEGSVTTGTTSLTDSTFQFVRVPSNCKVKQILLENGAATGGAMDIGVYRATDGQGGQPTSLLVANAIDRDFFASAQSIATPQVGGVPTNVTNESGTYTLDKRTQPLWQAVGLTADPGGSFDIVGSLTAGTTAAALVGISVAYTD